MITFVGIFSLVATLLVIAVAIFVFSRARPEVPNGNAPVYRVRKVYAVILIAVLGVGLALTLGKTPYASHAEEPPAVRVEVTGHMWSWELRVDGEVATSLVLPQGKLIEFAVSSGDVNHNFAIYDGEGRLLGQTQAMPGYVNRLRMVFDGPGDYHVLCLEYCGLMHHNMLTRFNVQ